jgi:hypothetical protein
MSMARKLFFPGGWHTGIAIHAHSSCFIVTMGSGAPSESRLTWVASILYLSRTERTNILHDEKSPNRLMLISTSTRLLAISTQMIIVWHKKSPNKSHSLGSNGHQRSPLQGSAIFQMDFTKMTSSAEGQWFVAAIRPQWVLTDNTFVCISKQPG